MVCLIGLENISVHVTYYVNRVQGKPYVIQAPSVLLCLKRELQEQRLPKRETLKPLALAAFMYIGALCSRPESVGPRYLA